MRLFCFLYIILVVKKNLFELFIGKLIALPLWVKQAVYYRLYLNMRENYCERFIIKNADNLFAFYNPTVTFKGKTELWDRKSGLDTNIYNFLRLCIEGYSILEISINTFLSVEEVAKNFMFCLEQNYIEKPESDEVYAMGGFIAGKFRTGTCRINRIGRTVTGGRRKSVSVAVSGRGKLHGKIKCAFAVQGQIRRFGD